MPSVKTGHLGDEWVYSCIASCVCMHQNAWVDQIRLGEAYHININILYAKKWIHHNSLSAPGCTYALSFQAPILMVIYSACHNLNRKTRTLHIIIECRRFIWGREFLSVFDQAFTLTCRNKTVIFLVLLVKKVILIKYEKPLHLLACNENYLNVHLTATNINTGCEQSSVFVNGRLGMGVFNYI